MIFAIVLEVEDESAVWLNQSANRLDYASPVLGMAAAGCLHYPFTAGSCRIRSSTPVHMMQAVPERAEATGQELLS
ncbi:hypothetical protein PO124_25320 [Bacillus licheniformis]|nr:hypothetical protein [Bacillus licheniformis]